MLKALEMHHSFYGETSFIPPEIIKLFKPDNLVKFLDQAQEVFNSSPFLTTLLNLIANYQELKEAVTQQGANALASVDLVKRFGVVQPGKNEDGEYSDKITKQIIAVHSRLVTGVEEAKKEKDRVVMELNTLLSSIYHVIVTTLKEYQLEEETKLEEKMKAEDTVAEYLKSSSGATEEVVVYQKIKESKQAGKIRKYLVREEVKHLQQSMKFFFSLTQSIFTPIKRGVNQLQEIT